MQVTKTTTSAFKGRRSYSTFVYTVPSLPEIVTYLPWHVFLQKGPATTKNVALYKSGQS